MNKKNAQAEKHGKAPDMHALGFQGDRDFFLERQKTYWSQVPKQRSGTFFVFFLPAYFIFQKARLQVLLYSLVPYLGRAFD